jgi:glycosyltransferase involved in cell wall biosynthesis
MIATLLALDHARVAQRLGVDHVHAHFATYPATAAMIMARLVGCTFSFTPHAQDIFVDQRGLRLKCREAAFVVAVSRYNRMFLQHFEADPNCLPVIRYGLPASYTYQPASLPAGPRHRVICVSSFREYKGQEYLIRALAARPELVNVEIEFIGDGPLRRGVEALAEQLGVRGRCTFSGKQDQGYVRRQLASAHVLVQPSIVERSGDTEGLPNTLIEAAASGALMVATEVTGIPELVHEGRTGFLALPRDPQSLADALIRATSLSDDEASRIRYAARALVESDYSIDDSALTLISWFRDAARPPRTAAT